MSADAVCEMHMQFLPILVRMDGPEKTINLGRRSVFGRAAKDVNAWVLTPSFECENEVLGITGCDISPEKRDTQSDTTEEFAYACQNMRRVAVLCKTY